jgi:hypothetical protein
VPATATEAAGHREPRRQARGGDDEQRERHRERAPERQRAGAQREREQHPSGDRQHPGEGDAAPVGRDGVQPGVVARQPSLDVSRVEQSVESADRPEDASACRGGHEAVHGSESDESGTATVPDSADPAGTNHGIFLTCVRSV